MQFFLQACTLLAGTAPTQATTCADADEPDLCGVYYLTEPDSPRGYYRAFYAHKSLFPEQDDDFDGFSYMVVVLDDDGRGYIGHCDTASTLRNIVHDEYKVRSAFIDFQELQNAFPKLTHGDHMDFLSFTEGRELECLRRFAKCAKANMSRYAELQNAFPKLTHEDQGDFPSLQRSFQSCVEDSSA